MAGPIKRSFSAVEHEVAATLVDLEMINAAHILVKFSQDDRHRKKVRFALPSSPSPEAGPFEAKPPGDDDDAIILKVSQATRRQRTVDPSNPADALLIQNANMAGTDIYDSDEDLPASPTSIFRKVKWGPAATDMSNDADFPTEPDFDQFVPGRWERMDDGSVRDQKRKLLVKLTNKEGKKQIFKNAPPKNWNNQEAMTSLNKRISQQIRRNTPVRFRNEVEPYVHEERVWICANLTEGKPRNGWKPFVEAFNAQFEGRTLPNHDAARPARTHSSLTKEIERFREKFYTKGEVPIIKEPKKKGHGKAGEKFKAKAKVDVKIEANTKVDNKSKVTKSKSKSPTASNSKPTTSKSKAATTTKNTPRISFKAPYTDRSDKATTSKTGSRSSFRISEKTKAAIENAIDHENAEDSDNKFGLTFTNKGKGKGKAKAEE